MPRPPVRPEDRKRSTRACTACRATKKRCDASQPCRPCVKRGVGSTCTYSQHIRARRAPPNRTPSVPNSRRRDQVSPLLYQSQESSLRDEDGTAASSTSDQTATSSGPRPVMMYTCSGEKVFVGNASAIAFLQYLRGSLRILGPGFTISQGCHRMFEAQIPIQQTEDFSDDIETAERKILVQRYLDASSGLLDLFDESDIEGLLAFKPRPHNTGSLRSDSAADSERLLCLYMMIAIGAQCRGQIGDAPKAFRYFSEARKLSFEGMLSDPSLNTARGFVLMAFYMFGACRRNSAFMYLGVATKAASVMGLHMAEQFQSLSESERSLRYQSRVDKSIRLFDVVCSSILGRPTSVAPCRLRRSVKLHEDRHRNLSVDAACSIAAILNRIVDTLTEESELGMVHAQQFLDEIRRWSKDLPIALRQRPKRGTAHSRHSQNREIAIGNIHVACTYYFGIILTTREFLIAHIMPQINNDMPVMNHHGVEGEAEDEKSVAELSDACVDAAVFMAEMCADALDSRTIMGNMCILKAWLFAAGLVLGFSLLAPDVPQNRGKAFHNALRVLDFLGHLSPQAAQYHRLLTSFSQAIDSFKTNSPTEYHQASAPYVERLLSFNLAESPETNRIGDKSQPHEGARDSKIPERSTGAHDPVRARSDQLDLSSFDPTVSGGEDLMLSLLWDDGDVSFGELSAFNMSIGYG
ncbi:hypothetical protein BDP55DRAFT_559584 [Colletotrichum godetiae]|uniref:Zn(2)-C6 fungal-type domain-containing protein n=1 Tax=Colletotrichum godetiae TaxID=1209918 RepID=A0AAJ0ADD6_9PEZI|nr:uncharacterized protein BDP55DRAFT_559584 [Colletotrichum godetiae]KAK1671850.1 hypothetical protein BDP55DRAFT_559584 [Colletotrichum godetiae]